MYVGCFEGQYIQPIIASYTVGDVDQCALLCLGSTYFSLEAGDACEYLSYIRDGSFILTIVQGTCGDSIVPDPARGDDSVCNVPCIDDHDEFCGGLKLLKRAANFLAAYSSSTTGASTATTPRPSIPVASVTSALGGIVPSSRPSFSFYANTTSSASASSRSATTLITSPLPFGCTDLACVSESNAGRNGAATTSSLPFDCDSKLPRTHTINGRG